MRIHIKGVLKMTNQNITVRGLNKEEYEAIKAAAKAELPFSVCIRIHKQKYAPGSIDIRPRTPRGSNDPFYKWTEEEFKMVLDFVIKHKLLYATTLITEVKAGEHRDQFGMQFMFWKDGFTFLQLVEGYEVPQNESDESDEIAEVIETVEEIATEIDSNDETFYTTDILSNNARQYGFTPDTIDSLIEKINTYALDPTFEEYGNFITEFKPKYWNDKNSEYKGYTSIFGNFHTYSNVFRILTNDPIVIKKIEEAVRMNQQTEDYRAAKVEVIQRKREEEESYMNLINKNKVLSYGY
ncbi:hypothetical protein D3C86_1286730 [compost metagenome]